MGCARGAAACAPRGIVVGWRPWRRRRPGPLHRRHGTDQDGHSGCRRRGRRAHRDRSLRCGGVRYALRRSGASRHRCGGGWLGPAEHSLPDALGASARNLRPLGGAGGACGAAPRHADRRFGRRDAGDPGNGGFRRGRSRRRGLRLQSAELAAAPGDDRAARGDDRRRASLPASASRISRRARLRPSCGSRTDGWWKRAS